MHLRIFDWTTWEWIRKLLRKVERILCRGFYDAFKEVGFSSHITSFSDFPSGLPSSYFSDFPPWIATEFITCSWTKIGDGILHKPRLPSEPSYCLWCAQFFEWRKCKETLLRDSLKSCCSFITGDLTNITVACYTRRSSLGQRPVKKATLITDDFFSSNCLASYCSYKYKFKASWLWHTPDYFQI